MDEPERTHAVEVRGGRGGGAATPLTPELAAGLRALPAAVDEPRLPGVEVTAPDPGFRLARLLRPIRWGLAVTVLLVAADALGSVALPSLVRHGVDGGVDARDPGTLWLVTAIGAVIVLVSWLVIKVQTVVTARTGETLLYLSLIHISEPTRPY